MLLKALISFGGKISMYAGEVREVEDKALIQDLLHAGYVEIAVPEAEIVEKPAKKAAKLPEKPAKKKKK